MNIEKFTDRARGFLQAAQTIAMREYHQRLTPEHLLKRCWMMRRVRLPG